MNNRPSTQTATSFTGGSPQVMSYLQGMQRGDGTLGSPLIGDQGNSLGDSVYWLTTSVFDPRTVSNYAGGGTYSTYQPGFRYAQLCLDIMYQLMFQTFRMRNEPAPGIVEQMIDTIADVGRLLAIYFTALSMSSIDDPEMRQRARILELHTTMSEMSTMLEYLPCPPAIVNLSAKYIGLRDVSGKGQRSYAGFLANGDFSAFLTLYQNVMSRVLALNFLRQMYPLIGDARPASPDFNPDCLEAFVNAHYKRGNENFAPWVSVVGATGEVSMLASHGILHSTFSDDVVERLWTSTGWAVPGSGIGGVASQRVWFPSLCRWKGTVDAAITRSNIAPQTYNNAPPLVTFETVQDQDLAANIAHEYNMASDLTAGTSAGNALVLNQTTGTSAGPLDPAAIFALENPRYRVNAGFELSQVSYRLDGNALRGLRSILAP